MTTTFLRLGFTFMILYNKYKKKERNSMNLTEAEDIKKRWQEYRGTIQKKIIMTLINMMV